MTAQGSGEYWSQAAVIDTLREHGERFPQMEASLHEVEKSIAALGLAVQNAPDQCPYKRDIWRAANNLERLENLEADVMTLKLGRARDTVIIGIIISLFSVAGNALVLYIMQRVLQ